MPSAPRLLLLVAMAGCDAPPPATESGAVPSSVARETVSPPLRPLSDSVAARLSGYGRRWTGDLDGMVERRFIRALVSPSRTSYFVERGVPHGISYEVLQAFEETLNRRLRSGTMKVRVLFIPVERDQLLTGLIEGRGDVAVAQITVTTKRRHEVAFSTPVASGVRELVVTGAGAAAPASLEGLSGAEVFVRKSSSYWEHLESLNVELTRKGKAPIRLRAAPEVLDDEDILEMVNAGVVPMTVVDDYLAVLWSKVLQGLRVHESLAVHEGGELAWAFRKGSPLLGAAVDSFMTSHRKGTTFGNTVIRRYTGSTTFIAAASATAERARFERMVEIFRRYGGQYDLDHLLMMAQAYQESRLDQDLVSHRGAVGVMQVMPTTGREMDVGDIRNLEPNVHAGIKYMRTVMDRYLKDDPPDALNRTLFSFAAYNAGPTRLRQLRAETARRGLDRNVWFDNVELVAADVIGPETVNYVGNIFKYYVAYQLIAETRAARAAARTSMP